MLGSEILDVAIGVVFVFVLVSLICSAVREGLEAWLKTRATHLDEGIRHLLHDHDAQGLARHLFEHPLVFGLFTGNYNPPTKDTWWPTALTRGRNLPSYIPSRNFALALMDIAARGPATDDVSGDPGTMTMSLDAVRANIRNLGNPAVQRVLLMAIDTAQDDFEKAVSNVAAWYDSGMDRVSGWYKRSTQWILFAIGVFVAVAFNVNTVAIADYLYHERAAREALVAEAQAAGRDQNFVDSNYQRVRTDLEALQLPIGWTKTSLLRPDPVRSSQSMGLVWLEAIGGWLLTAFAASLGAPFWFDLLNKIMVIRSTVKPHEKSPEEASEDRQIGKEQVAGRADTSTANQGPTTGTISTVPTTSQVSRSVPSGQPLIAVLPPDALDGCEVEVTKFTADEDLPAAEGGVA
jgi:hypothetical protein